MKKVLNRIVIRPRRMTDVDKVWIALVDRLVTRLAECQKNERQYETFFQKMDRILDEADAATRQDPVVTTIPANSGQVVIVVNGGGGGGSSGGGGGGSAGGVYHANEVPPDQISRPPSIAPQNVPRSTLSEWFHILLDRPR